MKKNMLIMLAAALALTAAGCQRAVPAAPPAPLPSPQPSATPDPALLDDGLDGALEELDAVE
ncbi:MAG: hypothetical protein G01um101431_922 [Parcubacteria group bacterium Gr01-1014_31]|nr:MAG: hypothetical protein G01um101431_922 [Parcubacteria group bacterium Gr01-1014_31]